MSEAAEPRAKRQKKDKHGRLAAFEKLKNLKGKGVKHKYEVDEVDNVYDTIDEREYTKKVISRQDEDWIVDDDGSGYVEDGREIFDDDLDSESIAAASVISKEKHSKKKKSISANAGKGNLQFMLSNMPTKKKDEVKLDDDDILSELINEIDESDKPSTSTSQNNLVKKPRLAESNSVLQEKHAAKDYMKSFTLPKPKINRSSISNKENTPKIVNENNEMKTIVNDPKEDEQKSNGECHTVELTLPEASEDVDKNDAADDGNVTNDMFDDDFDMSQFDDTATQTNESTKKVEEEKVMEDCPASVWFDWEAPQNDSPPALQNNVEYDTKELPLVENDSGNKVFRFFWWDSFGDPKGNVYLFGKIYCPKAKSYASCCVVVRNIDRKIYLLPRTHHMGSNGQPTDQAVSLMDVYNEFNNTFADRLGIKTFKSRKVTKNYAFNPEIPAQSDYLEVQYSAQSLPMNKDTEGKTFSKVFGTNSSFLELFLLDRKIKGPCWLDVTVPEPVTNPVSWCKFEINCSKPSNISVTKSDKLEPPPPLVTVAINIRTALNRTVLKNEIVMISCLTQKSYSVNKQAPNPPFQDHFCVFTKPPDQVLPLDIYQALKNFKATRVQKVDSERALLNYFLTVFAKIDPDLIVGHDLQNYQKGLLSDRIVAESLNGSKLSKLKGSFTINKGKLEKNLFLGRLVCDLTISAKELIKSRSYDLNTLCQTVLKVKEEQLIELDVEDIPKMYNTSSDILKLISITMQDTAYILKMMYELNVIPLALQITNIAGNIMSKTLLGGRSERNEYLLLHAFSEKDYIVPDKSGKDELWEAKQQQSTSSKKKPTYSGGLVLDPKVGFYDKLILLMDFNSLYPSIIQEYNICFTTIPNTEDENVALPDKNLPTGILPTEIRKLVESRREVKKLMKNPDISNDLRMQYNIRQMALKLTANSMYGCLGFSNSRFYAKGLAALVTLKGREILVNTRDLVQKLMYEVIYGDTDSLMINTNCLDYDQVFKIGNKIKQEVNKLYKQVELDIDGVFKYLLLLKKKKYAAVTLTKTKTNELVAEREMKGLDIVRRDWSKLAAEAGKIILDHILSDQSQDERINNIHSHLIKLKEDLEQNKVPLSLLVITKQLTKNPNMYANKNMQPHVQVALRYNKKGGKPLRAGDIVPYVICEDGSVNTTAMQRAYHIDEFKNSEQLKIDVHYYLSQQIHPVVTRLCEPIEGTDAQEIANCLGLDPTAYKKARAPQEENVVGLNIRRPEVRFSSSKPFEFTCISCKTLNTVESPFVLNRPFLDQCANSDCAVRPIDYLGYVQNSLTLSCRNYIQKYYLNELTCEDPACPNNTVRLPVRFAKKFPVCTYCNAGVMYRKFSEKDLYHQLKFFEYLFDLSKHAKKIIMEQQIELAFTTLKEIVTKTLEHSGYSFVSLEEMFDAIYK